MAGFERFGFEIIGTHVSSSLRVSEGSDGNAAVEAACLPNVCDAVHTKHADLKP